MTPFPERKLNQDKTRTDCDGKRNPALQEKGPTLVQGVEATPGEVAKRK